MASSSANDSASSAAIDPNITFRNTRHWDTSVPAPMWARLMINDAYHDKEKQVREAAKALIKATKEKEVLWSHLVKMEANPVEDEAKAARARARARNKRPREL